MMEGLAAAGAEPQALIIDAAYLKSRRTASSLKVKMRSWLLDRPPNGGMITKLQADTVRQVPLAATQPQ